MKHRSLFLFGFSLLLCLAGSARAASLVYFVNGSDADAAALNNLTMTPDFTVSTLDNVGFEGGTSITRTEFSAPSTPAGPTAGSAVGSEWLFCRGTTTQGTPDTTTDYFGFTVTADSGKMLNLNDLTFDVTNRLNTTGSLTTQCDIFASVNGGAFTSYGLYSTTAHTAQNVFLTPETVVTNLSGITGANSVEIRIAMGDNSGMTSKASWIQGIVLDGAVHTENHIKAISDISYGNDWNQAQWWSDNTAPSVANTYGSASYGIRTSNASTFAGASLSIDTGGSLLLKQIYGVSSGVTVNLILDGGTLTSANSTITGDQQFINGSINVNSDSFIKLDGDSRRRISIGTGTMSGSGNLTINGGNMDDIFQILSPVTSSHTGNWTVNGGRLIVNTDTHIDDSASVTLINSDSWLDFRSNQRIGSLSGSGHIQSSGSYTLTVGGDNTDTTFSGTINTTSVALTKEGTGRMTLSGVNLYRGDTTVNGGTLALGGDNVIDPNSDMIFNDGTTLETGGFDLASLATLEINGTVEFDFESLGTSQLVFADSSGVAWGTDLNIVNFGGDDSIRFGADNSGLTALQLAEITLNGSAVEIDNSGYVAAVPEPATMSLLALGGMAILRRRKK